MAVRGKADGNDAEPDKQSGLPPLLPLDPYALAVIRWKAMRLSKCDPFTAADIEDIEQDMALDLMRRARWYDPARGSWPAFFGRVTDNRIATLLTSARTKGRGWHCPKFSLNALVLVTDEGYVERHELLEASGHTALCSDAWRTTDLRLDLEDALDGMPLELKTICLRLQRESIKEIARSTGRPCAQIKMDIAHIRELLTAAGLAEYWHQSKPMESHDEQ